MKLIESVLEFHLAFDVPTPELPCVPGIKRKLLRMELMKEELRELEDGIDNGNLIQIADGIADLLYVVAGTAIEFGLGDRMEEIFNEVHRSNMSKLDENGKPLFRNDGKVLKSKLFKKPDLFPIVFREVI